MNVWKWFLKASLWIASAGLMGASAGLDGAYLAKLMPPGWGALGLVLNLVADVTSELGMYWYGRLQLDRSKKKAKRSVGILVGEVILVGYAWLFGWRQLVPIIAQVDPDAPWMAWIGAAFIPIALIVVGYIQSLLAGRIETETTAGQAETETAQPEPKPEPVVWRAARMDDFRVVLGRLNGQGETLTEAELKKELARDELLLPSRSTVQRWLKIARKG